MIKSVACLGRCFNREISCDRSNIKIKYQNDCNVNNLMSIPCHEIYGIVTHVTFSIELSGIEERVSRHLCQG